MEFQDVVRRRRMVRNFESRPVPPDIVGRGNSERFWNTTWEIGQARAAFRYQGLFNAPLIVVALSNEDAYLDRYAEPDKGWTDRDPARWPVPYWHVDTGFAALLMLLT